MKPLGIAGLSWTGISTCLALVGCIEIVEPSPPDLDLGTDRGGACPGICSCNPADIINSVYRFTKLTVEQPETLASTLDGQWAGEIANYLLNVVFVVNNAVQDSSGAAAFSNINITAGSAWRLPGSPYQVDPSFAPDSYCLMSETLNLEVDVTPVAGAQCKFTNPISTNLSFHLGPTTDPLMCAPLLDPANATPIMNLTFEFGFNDDCTAITGGHLDGCIPRNDANRICLCGTAGTCGKDGAMLGTEFPTGFTSTEELTTYCRTTCGQGGNNWLSFRAVLDMQSGDTEHTPPVMPTNCEVGGEPGYRLSAWFEDEEITDKFVSTTVSGNCLAP